MNSCSKEAKLALYAKFHPDEDQMTMRYRECKKCEHNSIIGISKDMKGPEFWNSYLKQTRIKTTERFYCFRMKMYMKVEYIDIDHVESLIIEYGRNYEL